MTTLIETPAKTPASLKKNLSSYSELRRRIRETMARGEERAQDAVERVRVRTNWEVGKLILEHILSHKERADYGQQVIKRLAADLEMSHTELKYRVQFARTYPIGRTSAQLSWSQIQALLAVNENEKREELVKRATKEKWTVGRTRSEIKKLRAADSAAVTEFPKEELLTPIQGEPHTYRVVIAEAGPWKGLPAFDLGFSNYHRPLSGDFPFKVGDIVQCSDVNSPERCTLTAVRLTEADLFTYRAYVIDVTDGDTLWMWIDLGFGFGTKQQLRLRGIDAPEIKTRDGQRAKRFVERELKDLPYVLITSTKSDKYDRYLADIFYVPARAGEQFLNNRLLAAGLASRV